MLDISYECASNVLWEFFREKKLFDTKKVLLFNYFPSHLTTTNSLDYIQKKLTLDELHVISESTRYNHNINIAWSEISSSIIERNQFFFISKSN